MSFGTEVDDEIQRGFVKQIADKIIQGYKTVINKAGDQKRRWIWELMQNAKDVENRFGQVSIQVILKEDKLIFKHNGDAFAIKHLTGLIQQVSSKDDQSNNDEVTGKFGTGFITTHLLSPIIDVEGYVKNKENRFKHFNIKLDRSPQTSEALIPHIDESLTKLRNLSNDDKFPVVENYQENRTEENFDTSFTYNLDSEYELGIAKEGINDLATSLPFTLAFLPKIKSVKIFNLCDNEIVEYEIIETKLLDNINEGKINYFKIEKTSGGNDKTYAELILFEKNGITLGTKVKKQAINENYLILPLDDNLPKLFKAFPLVGTENFNFPVVVNHKKFEPTEPRDGLYLKEDKSKEVIINRIALEETLVLLKNLVDWHINKGHLNLAPLAISELPKNDKGYVSEEWYQEKIQIPYRQFLLEKPIVNKEGDIITKLKLGEIRIPFYSKLNEEKNNQLWELSNRLHGKEKYIAKNSFKTWISIVYPQKETWGKEIFYTLENLIEIISLLKDLNSFKTAIDNNGLLITWFNDVFNFIFQEEKHSFFVDLPIIPNQNGKFKKLNELHFDNNIPSALIEINSIFNTDWKDDLIHKEITNEYFKSHQPLSVSDIAKAINESVKEKLENLSFDSTSLIQTLKLISFFSSDSTSFQRTLWGFSKDIFPNETPSQENVIPLFSDFNFEPVKKFTIRAILTRIEQTKNLTSLGLVLNKNKEGTVLWLNKFIKAIQEKPDYKHYIEKYDVIPNQLEVFRNISDIHIDGRIDESKGRPIPEKLIEILRELDPEQDWRNDLLHDGFGIQVVTRKTAEDIGNVIDDIVNRIYRDDQVNDPRYKSVILKLVNWSGQLGNEVLIMLNLKNFARRKAEIVLSTIEQGKDRGNLFRIMQSEANLDVLADIAESGIEIADLQSLAKAVKDIGEERLNQLIAKEKETQKDFQFKKQIGDTVQGAFELAFQAAGLNFKLTITDGKYDYIITNPSNQKSIYVEVKSYNPNFSSSVLMHSKQGKEAKEKSGQYILCVLPRNTANPDQTYFHVNARFVLTIGQLIKDKVIEAENIEQKISPLINGTIKIKFDDPTYKFEVAKSVWETNGALFSGFIQYIKVFLA